MTGDFRDAVGDVINRINPRHTLLFKEVNRLALLLREDSDQHISASHFAFTGRLNMEYSTLQHTLKAQRWLRFTVTLTLWDQRRGRVNEILQIGPQLVEVCPTRLQHIHRRGIV